MKTIIFIFIMAFSLYMAFIRTSGYKARLEKSKKMLLLSEKLRKNYLSELLSPIFVCREIIDNDIDTKSKALEAIGNEFAENHGADEFKEEFSKLFDATAEELDGILSALSECASNGYRISAAEYEKNKDLVYMLYPGVVAIISIIIM